MTAAEPMLRETLRVVAVGEGRVELEARRASACTACAAKRACATGVMAEMGRIADRGQDGVERISLPHHGPASPGDSAVVVMPSSAFLRAAGLAYLFPVLALVLCVSLCQALGLSDLIAAALCVPLLALSFLPFRASEKRGRLGAALTIEEIIPASKLAGAPV
jgi:sigma-E factor negative regulatory protein RseC